MMGFVLLCQEKVSRRDSNFIVENWTKNMIHEAEFNQAWLKAKIAVSRC